MLITMNSIKKIIGTSLAIFILSGTMPLSSIAADEPSKAEIHCEEHKPDFNEVLSKWNEGKKASDYQKLFGQMQGAHHDYIGCLFDYATSEILQTKKARFGSAFKANTPNSYALDWMAPKSACIEDNTEIKRLIDETSPVTLLGPLLQAHSDYDLKLEELLDLYRNEGENDKETDGFNEKVDNIKKNERQKKLEIDSSTVAMDVMLTSLKELRLSFVMHVRLQCTLQFLEKYRVALEGLRKVIDKLPRKTKDASITK